MNLAHLHLILNHVPVIGIPIAVALLIYAIWSRQLAVQKASLIVLLAASSLALPVFFSGEPAEKLVENLPGVSESLIDPHEDAAEFALTLTLIAGAAAAIGLIVSTKPKMFYYAVRSTLALAIVAALALAHVANLGGQIRHTEIRGQIHGRK